MAESGKTGRGNLKGRCRIPHEVGVIINLHHSTRPCNVSPVKGNIESILVLCKPVPLHRYLVLSYEACNHLRCRSHTLNTMLAIGKQA